MHPILFGCGAAGACFYISQARLSIYILILASEIESKRMSPNFIGGEYSLSSRGVIKIIKRSKVMRWKSGEP